jgi:Methylamine utilisation protein MauE
VVDLAVLGGAAQLLLALIFGLAVLNKTLPGRSLQPTVSQIGFPDNVARLVAYGVVGLEASAAVGLAIAPARLFPYLLVAILAVAFACAGGWAIVTGRRIECGCFGSPRGRPIGWRQLAALPLWLASSATAAVWVSPWSLATGLGLLSSFVITVIAIRAARLITYRRTLRWDRWATPAVTPGPRTIPIMGRLP